MFTLSGFQIIVMKSKVIARSGKVTCVFKNLEEMLKTILG